MKRALQIFFPVAAAAILLFVWSVSIRTNGGLAATFGVGGAALAYNLFRLAGLTAFTLVSFQVLTGPYLNLWEKLYGQNFYRFHAFEGLFALLLALLHPLLLWVSLGASGIAYAGFLNNFPFTVYFGPLALAVMIITVSTAAASVLLRKKFFEKRWHLIHLANYLVFLLVFFHSLTVGTDVAAAGSALRPLWWLFFAGAVAGLLYRRVYLPLRRVAPRTA